MLSGSYLYGFKSKDSPKAACLIFLSGFTVAVANEVSGNFILNPIIYVYFKCSNKNKQMYFFV